MRILLLCNPDAGGGRARRVARAADAIFRDRGATTKLLVPEQRELLTKLAHESSGEWDRVVVAGGDGTVHHALREIDLERSVLGVIPAGSGDDFAQSIGIPRNIHAACDAVLHGEVRRVDVALANGSRYVGVAGMGLDAQVARWVNEHGRGIPRSLVYMIGLARVLPSWQPKRIVITIDGQTLEEDVMFAVVANSRRYGGGIEIAPTARMNDRELDLHVIRRCSKAKLLWTMPKSYRGRHLTSGIVWWQRGQSFTIEAEKPLEVFADGEHITNTPVTFGLDPLPLMVCAPRQE